jgi:adenosylcobinamide kinase / adenosylcobinamide-phosphate guanylyltransferase
MPLWFVGGGSRSGKSTYALRLARAAGPRRVFVATAQAWDDEMKDRIRLHQQERDASFRTVEEPLELAAAIERESTQCDALVVDCLTLWLSNLMMAERATREEFQRMLDVATASSARVILVSNETGCGIVPDNALARRFRDLQGTLNQAAASRAERAWWMVFGAALELPRDQGEF